MLFFVPVRCVGTRVQRAVPIWTERVGTRKFYPCVSVVPIPQGSILLQASLTGPLS